VNVGCDALGAPQILNHVGVMPYHRFQPYIDIIHGITQNLIQTLMACRGRHALQILISNVYSTRMRP